MTDSNLQLVEKALVFAKTKHKRQRYGDKPFIVHPQDVFHVLNVLLPDDSNLLAAALLHDTLEDTPVSHAELKKQFNADVANLVREVTKSEYNTFPHLTSKRGVVLKFADRLSNLSHMEQWPLEQQQQYIAKSRFWQR